MASLARREDQTALSWNLLLGEKEDTIQILQEQLGHKLDVDSKEELYKEELDKEEQAGLKEELDALAREEAGLNNLLFSITDALSTVQGCPPCSPAAGQLEEAIAQLAVLTALLGGDRLNEDKLSYRSSLEKEESLPTPSSSSSTSSTSSSRSSLEREARSLSPASLCSQDREWSYSVSYISSTNNLQQNEEDAESCYYSYPGPSPGPSSPLPDPHLGLRRQGSTSILLERNLDTGDIISIVRLDSQQPPAILYSKELDSEAICDYVDESEVTYHNYTAVERREESCQTEEEEKVLRLEGATQTKVVASKEESAQTEELEDKEVDKVRRRRESRELALTLAQQELACVIEQLEAAQEKGAEQVAEIELLGRRVDQLQRRRGSLKAEAEATSNRPTTFIIKDMQSQVQELEEKNIKKDSLIKKLAETVVKSPGLSVHAVIDSLRTATVKPSDRRIDFDIDTLLSFLERRKLSSSSSSSSLSSFSTSSSSSISFSSSSLPRMGSNISISSRSRQ